MAAIDYPQQGYGSPLQGLAAISHEIMVFMRGHYRLDETGNGKDTLRFRQGGKTILTVYLRQDHLTFLVVLGQKERELFEAHREAFSPFLLAYYDVSKTHHDGKWLFIDVTTPEQLAEVKKLVLLKKKPNRKPFPTQTAVYGMCGQRCDLCIHYTGTTDEQRALMKPYLDRMWGESDWSMRCGGCLSDTCYCHDAPCPAKSCAAQKGLSGCAQCPQFPCLKATTADHRSMVHTETHLADEITWGILPYVPYQYEKKEGEAVE